MNVLTNIPFAPLNPQSSLIFIVAVFKAERAVFASHVKLDARFSLQKSEMWLITKRKNPNKFNRKFTLAL